MQKVIYNGHPTTLAGHGPIKKGDEITVTEQVADYIKRSGDKDFTFPKAKKKEGEEDGEPPGKGDHFDLRTIPWDNPELSKTLLKKDRKELLKICAQLTAQGMTLECSADSPADRLVDQILASGKEAGWING